MVAGGHFRPPYGDALSLGGWAWENRSLLEGRITLAGGDPDTMTLRRYLDVAYAIFVEEYQRLGMNLMDALEKTESMRARKIENNGVSAGPSEAEIARRNEASLQELNKLLGAT